MRFREFADTGISLSELTFGTTLFVKKDAAGGGETGQEALRAALDAGINCIHSSTDYGTYWAVEPVLRDHPKRHELRHIIKASVPDYDEVGFDPNRFRAVVEESLRQLHTDNITVVQHLQRGVPKALIYDEASDATRLSAMPAVNEQLFDAFERLRDEGKVGYLAFYPHTHAFAGPAIRSGGFKAMVWFYNLLQTEMSDLLPEMLDRRMAYLALRPYLEGIITDKRARRDLLPANDPRRASSWDETYERFELIQQELGAGVTSWTRMAIQFALASPIVPTVILGMNTPEQVASAVAAIAGDYPDAYFVNRVHAINAREGLVRRQV